MIDTGDLVSGFTMFQEDLKYSLLAAGRENTLEAQIGCSQRVR